MKIGFPFWYGYGRDFEEIIDEVVEAGFDYLEISLDYPWPSGGEFSLREVIHRALKDNLAIAFHGPWRDIRLSSPIERVRKVSVELFKSLVEEISGYGCEYLVVHLSTDQAIDRIPSVKKESIKAAAESARELNAFVKERGLKIVFENVREILQDFLEITSRANSKVCVDVSHIICTAVRNKKKNQLKKEIINWIASLRDKIEVIHYSGVKFFGNWVKDHLVTDEKDEYLQLVKKEMKALDVKYFLLEIFEDMHRKEVRPKHLSGLVSFLKEP